MKYGKMVGRTALLMLAETKTIRAWAELPLSCQYKQFSLDGIVDGVLGKRVTSVEWMHPI